MTNRVAANVGQTLRNRNGDGWERRPALGVEHISPENIPHLHCKTFHSTRE